MHRSIGETKYKHERLHTVTAPVSLHVWLIYNLSNVVFIFLQTFLLEFKNEAIFQYFIKEPKKEGRVCCAVSYIEVYGIFMEKHAKTRHIHVVSLLMKKRLRKSKEHTSESRLTIDFLYRHVVPPLISFGKGSCSQCNGSLSDIRSDQPRLVKYFNYWSLTYSVKCVIDFITAGSLTSIKTSGLLCFVKESLPCGFSCIITRQ